MMIKEKNNTGLYSFKSRLRSFFYLLLGVVIVAMSIYVGLFTYTLQQRTYRDVMQLLSLYNEQTSSNLKSVDYYLMELSNYSTDISSVALLDDISDNYNSIIRISQMFEFNLRSFPTIKGMYAYFPRSKRWVGYSNSSDSRISLQPYLKEQFQNEEILADIKNTNGLKWIPYNYEDNTYLVKTFFYDNSMVGAWTDLKTLASSLRSLKDMDALILFTDKTGDIVSIESPYSEAKELINDISDYRENIKLPVNESLNSYSVITVAGKSYMVTTAELEYCDYFITAMIPMRKIISSTDIFWGYAIMFILILLMAFSVIVYFFNRLIHRTMSMMTTMNNAIIAGEPEHRIDISNEKCVEVLEVATTYNKMVDHIQKLKVDVYEEGLQKKNFQLFFLRSQVAPHFLINCLNMITYLADGSPENTAVLRKMIETLSKHLRYTLGTDEQVPISKELEFLDNYVELTKLRFPGCIIYEKSIDESSLNAAIFPVMLIMFMENTFKHNLVMGEQLKVIDKIDVYENDGNKRLHITHIDSGEGFDDAFLEDFKKNHATTIKKADGSNIGINNVIHRLQLYYGETASMNLTNEPGMGARIDIDIPYVEFQESKNKKETVHGIIS